MKTLVYILYDSILNSVFQGQVLQPLIERLSCNSDLEVCIISFESMQLSQKQLDDVFHSHKRLKIIILKRNPFFTSSLLFPEIQKLKKQLLSLESYEIIARGPLAGLIAQRALDPAKCLSLTIQARGLVAEEHKYVHKDAKGIYKLLHCWRVTQYANVEKLAFGRKQQFGNYNIEVVSNALKDYLVMHCDADSGKCFLAQNDVPSKINVSKLRSWRIEVRKKLNINFDTMVYCFSGAAKSWQCPKFVIEYFVEKYSQNSASFLLVLTFDVEKFKTALKKVLPEYSYCVECVCNKDVYRFMAAADKGLVFREKNIVSWVARPVKAMEYEASGLSIVHNNSVDWIIRRFGKDIELS